MVELVGELGLNASIRDKRRKLLDRAVKLDSFFRVVKSLGEEVFCRPVSVEKR